MELVYGFLSLKKLIQFFEWLDLSPNQLFALLQNLCFKSTVYYIAVLISNCISLIGLYPSSFTTENMELRIELRTERTKSANLRTRLESAGTLNDVNVL